MAKASFRFGRNERKPLASFNFLRDDEEEDNPFSSRIRAGLNFEPVQDIGPRQDIYKPEIEEEQYPAMEAFARHMRDIPRQDEYAPGLGRKIGAALVGFASGLKNPVSGYQMTREILDNPYKNAYQNWADEANYLKTEAQLEEDLEGRKVQRLRAEREIEKDERDAKLNERKVLVDEERLLRDLQNDKIKQQQDKDEYIARGWKEIKVDGRVKMVNPITNETRDLGEDADIKIREKQADIAQQNADTNLRNVESLEDSREWNTRISAFRANAYADKSKAAGTQPKNIPQREIVIAEQNAALDLIRSNPEYINFVDKNTGQVKRPSVGGFFGMDTDEEALYDKFIADLEQKKSEILNRKYGQNNNDDNEIVPLSFNDLIEK